MPYNGNSDLPGSVRTHLPDHAQDIYRSAYNNAWKEYDHNEARSHQVAWAAVKHSYEKNASTGQWYAMNVEIPSNTPFPSETPAPTNTPISSSTP